MTIPGKLLTKSYVRMTTSPKRRGTLAVMTTVTKLAGLGTLIAASGFICRVTNTTRMRVTTSASASGIFAAPMAPSATKTETPHGPEPVSTARELYAWIDAVRTTGRHGPATATWQMARWDPETAVTWTAQISSVAKRDDALVALIARTTSEFPESAATWLSQISDPQKRRNAAKTVGRDWFELDRTTAVPWMAQMGITAAELDAMDNDDELVVLSPFSM